MTKVLARLRASPWYYFLVLAVLSAVAFLTSFAPIDLSSFVEAHGPLIGGVWKLVTGLATVLSLVLAIYSFRSDGLESRAEGQGSPETVIRIESNDGAITIPLVIGDRGHPTTEVEEAREDDGNESA